ncbi:hypothetical protein ACN27B_30095 [Micromonospora sp. WMMD754]|uniref:hypothetical protein n=1 Tax=Micromonospora sp. WMMD754 TaxID=3404114 RepID=UPI003BF586FF
MGTSYETVLVAAEFTAVVEAVTATGRRALVVPVVDDRVAVIPREGAFGVAELRPIATLVGKRLACPVLTSAVFDSDVVQCCVFHDGVLTHRYVSDLAMIVEWFEDDDGEFKPRLDGKVLPPGQLPEGPLGDDAAAFAPFAVGAPHLDGITAALRNADGDRFAEGQHAGIMESLKLPPDALTVGFRHVRQDRFPSAVLVSAGATR